MYDIAVSLVETVSTSEQDRLINYVLVPFNDPDFYPMLVTFNGTILLRHLDIINSHGASGGKVNTSAVLIGLGNIYMPVFLAL